MCDFVFILLGSHFLTQFILHPFPPTGNTSEQLCRFPSRSAPHSKVHVYRCAPTCAHTHTHTRTIIHIYIHVWEVLIIVWPNRVIYASLPPLSSLLLFFLLSWCVELLKLQPSLSARLSPAFFLILYYLAAMAHIFILLELKSYWNKVLSYKSTLLHAQPGL